MPKFIFQMGVNARCYGSVEAEAETIEQAVAMLTADYVGDNIAVSETTWDGLTGLAIIDVSDEDCNAIHDDYTGTDLPSEYDPPYADADMLAALKAVADCPQAAPWLARLPMEGGGSVWDAVLAAVAKAEG